MRSIEKENSVLNYGEGSTTVEEEIMSVHHREDQKARPANWSHVRGRRFREIDSVNKGGDVAIDPATVEMSSRQTSIAVALRR